MAMVTGPVGPGGVTGPRSEDRYGLFSVAEMDTLPYHAGGGGLQWITSECGISHGYRVACGVDLAAKTFDSGQPSFQVALPFVVYATRVCGPVGFTTDEQQAMVVSKLLATEQAATELVFSDQLFDQSPGLANNAAVVTVPAVAGTNFADQIGRLEAAFYALYGQAGVLHVPFRAGDHMSSQHLLWPDREHPMPGNRPVWRTASRSAVSIGNYTGNSPVGVAPAAGTQWIYMTPQVKIWAQPTEDLKPSPIEGSLNRTTNQETWLVERNYVMGFECAVVLAILATLPTQVTT